mmetsp:Transcript_48616/g.81715  ORF Transcript_48616/g.81715 Transcript_48616/m.81715 type:complete len:210 (-) Transcript_48616:524-1153(-)
MADCEITAPDRTVVQIAGVGLLLLRHGDLSQCNAVFSLGFVQPHGVCLLRRGILPFPREPRVVLTHVQHRDFDGGNRCDVRWGTPRRVCPGTVTCHHLHSVRAVWGQLRHRVERAAALFEVVLADLRRNAVGVLLIDTQDVLARVLRGKGVIGQLTIRHLGHNPGLRLPRHLEKRLRNRRERDGGMQSGEDDFLGPVAPAGGMRIPGPY